jgi:hypothetical protein
MTLTKRHRWGLPDLPGSSDAFPIYFFPSTRIIMLICRQVSFCAFSNVSDQYRPFRQIF